jgi:hypothetical protein
MEIVVEVVAEEQGKETQPPEVQRRPPDKVLLAVVVIEV